MRVKLKRKWHEIQGMVRNMQGEHPKSEHCVKNAVQRVTAAGKKGIAKTRYENCGRKKKLTEDDTKKVCDFVRKWKRNCSAPTPA